MEQTTRYLLMWSRRKILSTMPSLLINSPIPPAGAGSTFHESSWEEQAFAEDSSGLMGGCVWPPRSYTCSFCRREFRSAQALGGHMNVHRRDRARLKQCSSPTGESPDLHLIPAQIISTEEGCYSTANPNSPSPVIPRRTLTDPSPVKQLIAALGKRGRRDADHDETAIGNKRRRVDEEELDLELRLGDPPKVK